MQQCHCVFPSPSEDELITLPGSTPGTALRIMLESSSDGYVRLQHLAHDQGLGWYVQKTMVLEREVLGALVPQLRKALCMMAPKGRTPRAMGAEAQASSMRLVAPPTFADADDSEPLTRCGS